MRPPPHHNFVPESKTADAPRHQPLFQSIPHPGIPSVSMFKTKVPIPTLMQCIPQRKTGQQMVPLRGPNDAKGNVSRGTGMYWDKSTMSAKPITPALSFTIERIGQPKLNWDPTQRDFAVVSTFN